MAQIVCKLETIKSAKDRSFHVSQIPHMHKLWKLIDSCLQKDMRRRPSARDICESIKKYGSKKNQNCNIYQVVYITRSSDIVEATKRESNDTQPVKKVHTCSV